MEEYGESITGYQNNSSKENKIKDIYSCKLEQNSDSNKVYNLEIWYNKLLEKTYSELTVADVLRMIRQEVFVEIALKKAIDILKNNPLVGEMYEGELLEKVLKEEIETITKKYNEDIKMILKKAKEKAENYEWITNDEKNDFLNLIKYYKLKL